ncbi:MAG: Cys-tRNA(Pro) deacylase [Verrucomicrobia bacterium]|nr:Cys-tRNA(Pro) deacylase [Verrucomicrobiota bacterium]MBR5605875.1 Cys-tRNA(Pro) deacylase [Verrucomicrobiota bacterium]MBR5690329.1 Cys-tRNA(Pro) deacylase [Verrucomicrobiota bacterium]MBR5738017.1 Cys-tRNA(Pro) deacylase [Verrucomicrobiota bacterium]MBR5978764.1 Cys-tRNA(Pro) deacylase [Verrucomicrobiota bacterium]
MKNSSEKTNVMRILGQHKIPYTSYTYSGVISGADVAAVLKQDPRQVFKTLVTVGHTKTHYVFVVPVCGELDLKKAAVAVGEKSIEMIKSKELFPLTGYVHGGCSPIGMKKLFRTVIDQSAGNFETIIFSAGKIGYQVQVTLENLKQLVPFELADIAGS